MKVILDIDSNALEIILKKGIINSENKISNVWVASELMDALDNAVTLPDNATNEDMIKAMFPQAIFTDSMVEGYVCNIECHLIGRDTKTMYFDTDWWNASYEGGTT